MIIILNFLVILSFCFCPEYKNFEQAIHAIKNGTKDIVISHCSDFSLFPSFLNHSKAYAVRSMIFQNLFLKNDHNVTLNIANVLNGSMLESLKLQNNSIGDNGAAAIGNVLRNSNLTTLDLSWNSIGPDGAKNLQMV